MWPVCRLIIFSLQDALYLHIMHTEYHQMIKFWHNSAFTFLTHNEIIINDNGSSDLIKPIMYNATYIAYRAIK